MAQGNRSACLPVTLAYEGGLSMNRADPGNWTGGKVGVGELKGTKYGIAASSHPSLDIADLSLADASAIYDREYWTPAGCETLPLGLDLCHFDGTVNSGRGNSSKWLKIAQQSVGTDAIHDYSSARLHSLQSFKTWATFGKGWGARVAGVEAKALAMAGLAASSIANVGTQAASQAKTASMVAHGSAVVAGAGATAAIASSHTTAGVLAAIAGVISTILSAFHASASGTRAVVLSHASAVS